MTKKSTPSKEQKEILQRMASTIATASGIAGRAALASRMGQQYGGDRDVYQALGYPTTIYYDDYDAKYRRQDIAKAVINRPTDATWRGDLTVQEPKDKGADDTALEKEWVTLEKEKKLKSVFRRVDKLAGVGSYAVLFLGFNDVGDQSSLQYPVSKMGGRKLLYVKPFSERSAVIKTLDDNPGSDRYGLPVLYSISIGGGENSVTTATAVDVHFSRVIHIVREKVESDVNGEPSLKGVYNRLMDLEKIVGGSAEMFWRGARPGYQAVVDPEFEMSTTTAATLQDQFDEFEHHLRRIFNLEGMELKALAPQVASPKEHVDIQVQMISAETGIPKRILTGSELGELASSEDRNNWFDLIDVRREEYAEPEIVKPFIDRCIEFKVLPEPSDEYSIVWPELRAASEKDKADVGRVRAEALRAYTANMGAEAIVPPQNFLEYFLGLTDDQVKDILSSRENEFASEIDAIAAEEADAAEPVPGEEEDD